jgi:hypothetical protein
LLPITCPECSLKNPLELPINGSLQDDMLFKITKSDPLVCKYYQFYGCGLCATRGKQKEAHLWKSSSHMGWVVPLQSLFWRSTQKMCTGRRRHQDHWTMSFITIWRTLWHIPHSFKDLVKWILLANHVWRHKGLHSKVWSVSEAWKYQFKRCHATHQQPLDRALWCHHINLYMKRPIIYLLS